MRLRPLALVLFALALGGFASSASAENDNVQFGSNIHVAPGQTVHDTVCFFCGVEDEGTVEGDVVVFFGNVHIDGHANHDVVTFFGNVTASDDSAIGESLVNFFGTTRLGENVTVGKDIVSMFGSFRAAGSASNGGDRVVQPAWLFWTPLLVLFLILFVVVREIRHARRRRLYMAGFPYPPARP